MLKILRNSNFVKVIALFLVILGAVIFLLEVMPLILKFRGSSTNDNIIIYSSIMMALGFLLLYFKDKLYLHKSD